jgi:hypothetical protein
VLLVNANEVRCALQCCSHSPPGLAWPGLAWPGRLLTTPAHLFFKLFKFLWELSSSPSRIARTCVVWRGVVRRGVARRGISRVAARAGREHSEWMVSIRRPQRYATRRAMQAAVRQTDRQQTDRQTHRQAGRQPPQGVGIPRPTPLRGWFSGKLPLVLAVLDALPNTGRLASQPNTVNCTAL